ncbi:MAG: IS1 family transposase [Nitrosomonadales bacterium]|nr:IS1 family transposase [Nitrosomonadales bacterium]
MGDTSCCPHCAAERVVRNGSSGYSRRTFNALTCPPLAGLHIRGKWLDQVVALRDGLPLTQAMERLNVSRPTAFRWRHRFLALGGFKPQVQKVQRDAV